MKTAHLLAGMLSLCGAGTVFAQTAPGQYAWEEFSKRIQASEKVAPLGPNFAGEQVSLSNGGLSFAATDVSLPGNNALRVEFSRSYNVFSRKDYGDLGMLADWVVDAPSINAVFAPNWVLGLSQSTNRCTEETLPRAEAPFTTNDFWQGLRIDIPGVTSGDLMRTRTGVDKPTDGPTYFWLTNERVHVSCLSTVKNTTGQGFLAITPDGTRYWFDWMGQTPEPVSFQMEYFPDGIQVPRHLVRKKNYLYATRVEDRFGNYVTYTYANAANEPGKLTRIEGSDGRVLSIGYSGAQISTVSDGTRTWTYTYATTSSGRKTLSAVLLPDASKWTIDLGSFTNAEILYPEYNLGGEIIRNCTFVGMPLNHDSTFVGAITHPAGARGEFTLGVARHGRSWVPISCRNFRTTFTSGPNKGSDNNPNDDINMWSTSAYSLTLMSKKVTGPGLDTATWTYAYSPNTGYHMYPGTTEMWPICDQTQVADCSAPPCTSDSCAMYSVTTVTGPNNDWTRYVHGNTYRYNEGKLIRVESADGGPTAMLKTETHTYDLSQAGDKGYPPSFGNSLRPNGDGFASEFHRPKTKTEIVQQGVKFVYTVDQFDPVARPTQVTRSSTVLADATAPRVETPTLTAPVSATAGTAHSLSWTSVSGTKVYQLERSVNGAGYTNLYTGQNTSISTSYDSAAVLSYRVRSCNVYGACDAYSSAKMVTVAAPPMGTPTLTAPAQTGSGAAFNVQWTAVTGASKYVLEKSVDGVAYASVYSGSATNSVQTHHGATYVRFRVKACDAANVCGLYSNVTSTRVVSSGGGPTP